jgi:dTMP kinase
MINMNHGIFIVFEGPNRAGKSYAIGQLEDALNALGGVEVVSTREPGGSPLGEGLRTVLKDPAMKGGAFASALVFEGGRKEHLDHLVAPAIERGAIVLCDRYYPSTEVFQMELSGDLECEEKKVLKLIHSSLRQPDLTVFIIPQQNLLDERMAEAEATEADAFEGNPMEREAYERFAVEYSRSHLTLVFQPSLANTRADIGAEVLAYLEATGFLAQSKAA